MRSIRACTLDFASRSFRLSSQLSNSAVRSIFTIRELYPMVYVQSSAFIHNVESSTHSRSFSTGHAVRFRARRKGLLLDLCFHSPDGQSLKGKGISSVAKVRKLTICCMQRPRLRPNETRWALGVSFSNIITN